MKLVSCHDHDRRSIAKQNGCDKQWLVAAKNAAHVETLHACMYSFKVCKAFGVIFVGRDFAKNQVDQCQMCSTYRFQPKFLCLHLHLFDTW